MFGHLNAKIRCYQKMLRRIVTSHDQSLAHKLVPRCYSYCCPPPQPPPCGCPPPDCGKKKPIVPPTTCRPGPIPPNPCCPVFHHGKDTWKKYKYITFFVCFPLIALQAMNAFSHEPAPKEPCRDYEYMRIRTKRYPWGDGTKTLFHNDHVNNLPGECTVPESECD